MSLIRSDVEQQQQQQQQQQPQEGEVFVAEIAEEHMDGGRPASGGSCVASASTAPGGWGPWGEYPGWLMRKGRGLVNWRFRAPDGQEYDEEDSAIAAAKGAAPSSSVPGERGRKQPNSFDPAAEAARAQVCHRNGGAPVSTAAAARSAYIARR